MKFLVILCALIGLSQSQIGGDPDEITEIWVYTGANDMGLVGHIEVEIHRNDLTPCYTGELNSVGTNFNPNSCDPFARDNIGSCRDFQVPNYDIPLLTIQHSGVDSWLCEGVTVVFNDGTQVYCPDRTYADGDDYIDIYTCEIAETPGTCEES